MHIFMELMPGTIKGACAVFRTRRRRVFADEIRQNGALTERVACKYTWQVLDGLAYLHHIRIVHRDIKSTNILRDGKGNVKIGDFGSAKQLQTVCSANGDTFIGTPHYIAPEMILGKHTTSAVDIW
jgi:serine/threonine protein kinase